MPAPVTANDFRRQWQDTEADVMAAVRDVGASGWYILGESVKAFEHALAQYWGIEHAVGVASGLDALELALRALGCKPGDRVLTTPVSAFATTLAIVKIGAVPVFVDCDDNGLLDLAACRRILERDANIRFFVPVHLYGHALHGGELAKLRDDFDLKLVEDCAQSIGAESLGRPTGTVGQIAATSFYPTKNLGALGDGGAVLTSTSVYAERLRVLRDYGQSGKYRHDAIGYNSRLDELHAAVLQRAHLPRVDEWTRRRRNIARRYRKGIQNPRIRVPAEPEGSQSCYHLFPICVECASKRGALEYFRAQGIGVAEHYPTAIPDQPAMTGVNWLGDTPGARRFCASQISLPVHPYLDETEVARVIDACNRWRSY
jgi:dTDP-3-amino-3,4,6-trideoxy-alpha-D-glucose transaminase